jgi:hypothetical protein
MKNIFKVAKYKKTEEGFSHLGYDEYVIEYLKGKKVHQLRIVVNGILTNSVINLVDPGKGYRNSILMGISDYVNGRISHNNTISEKKKITISNISNFYSKHIVSNVKNYLIGINKEESRDRLTKYGLIPKEESQNLENFRKLVSDEVSPAMSNFIEEKKTEERIKKIAERFFEEQEKLNYSYDSLESFIEGYKLAQQQMYNEDDMEECWNACLAFNRPAGFDSGINFKDFIKSKRK